MLSRFKEFFSLDYDSVCIKKVYRNEFKFKSKFKDSVLIEAFQTPSNEIAILFFLKVYIDLNKVTPIAYFYSSGGLLENLKIYLRFKFSPLRYAGVNKILLISSGKKNTKCFSSEADIKIQSINSNYDLELMKIDEVVVGDLIYDQFLHDTNSATVDIKDNRLTEMLKTYMNIVDKLRIMLQEQRVKAVLVSHTVYKYALPVRIALETNIEAFQITGESIYRLTKEQNHAYKDFMHYPKIYAGLPESIKLEGLREAERRIERRLKGEIGVDMHYSTQSAFKLETISNQGNERVLCTSQKLKVLVAVHDFYDSPHPFGNNFYPDVYLWLEAIARMSKNVDYEWYIKLHPDVVGEGLKIIKDFCKINSSFTLIPSDTSHHQIINEGIDFALTVWGTIGFEYPLLGIPVINASTNNPHAAYNFSITPSNKAEYEVVIQGLSSLKHVISKEEIYEYYFMHKIYRLKSLLFKDYEKYLNDIGGYKRSTTKLVYSYFCETDNRLPYEKITHIIRKFLKSKDNWVQIHHRF